MKNSFRISLFISVAIAFTGCKVFNDPVIVPGYIYIPSYSFETKPDGTQGDSVNKITEAWVYSNGNIEGAFAYPVLIPIQKNGPTEIALEPGIVRSGQSADRVPYILAQREYYAVDLKPGKTDTIIPVFNYNPQCSFLLVEDFDNSSGIRLRKNRSHPNDTIMKFGGPDARTPGKLSGKVVLFDSTDYFELVTTDNFSLKPGDRVFLEMDYNSDVLLRIGFYATPIGEQTRPIPMLYTNATNGWNRIYIDLSEEIGVLPAGTIYQPFISVLKEVGSPSPRIWLDNIKIIKF
ncbi:MAG: hypothetical protein V4658_01210 [Bacteroidota bacterium]